MAAGMTIASWVWKQTERHRMAYTGTVEIRVKEQVKMEILSGIDLGFWGVVFIEMLAFALLLVVTSGLGE